MSALADSGDNSRAGLYRRLAGRNRLISALRIVVPAIGALLLFGLIAQIVVTNMSRQLGIGSISLDRTKVTVETPRYAGVMSDGTAYRVRGEGAIADMERLEVITMRNAELTLDNPDGTQTIATAASADLQTNDEQVTVAGVMDVVMSGGTVGTLVNTFIDMPTQHLIASGPVRFDFGDGAWLNADGMDYKADEKTYVFTNVELDQPYLGGTRSDDPVEED